MGDAGTGTDVEDECSGGRERGETVDDDEEGEVFIGDEGEGEGGGWTEIVGELTVETIELFAVITGVRFKVAETLVEGFT
jgi:hypothetical protein